MIAPTELDERAIDVAIESLGIEFLRELRAIAWFCDSSADGKMALVPSSQRHWYEPGGMMEPLASTGCVRLLGPSYCATVRQHRPSIRVEQFGRRVLVRARAMRLPIEIDDDQPCALPSSEAGWRDMESAREGFDQSFVTRETAALTGEADSTQTEDNSQSSAPSPDEGSGDAITSSVGDTAANLSDAGKDGVDEGAGDIEAREEPSASSAPDLSDEDRAWLLSVAKQLWAATGVGEQDLVSGVAGDLRKSAPETISGGARAKALSIVKQCKLVCYGEQDAADTLELIAGIVGVETKDIV